MIHILPFISLLSAATIGEFAPTSVRKTTTPTVIRPMPAQRRMFSGGPIHLKPVVVQPPRNVKTSAWYTPFSLGWPEKKTKVSKNTGKKYSVAKPTEEDLYSATNCLFRDIRSLDEYMVEKEQFNKLGVDADSSYEIRHSHASYVLAAVFSLYYYNFDFAMDQIREDFDMDVHSEEYFKEIYDEWINRIASWQKLKKTRSDDIYESYSHEPLLALWLAGIAKGWKNPLIAEQDRVYWVENVIMPVEKRRTNLIGSTLALYSFEPRLGVHKVMTSLRLTFSQLHELFQQYAQMDIPADDTGAIAFIAQFVLVKKEMRVEQLFEISKNRRHGIHMAVREFDMPLDKAAESYDAWIEMMNFLHDEIN
jgi:hypothetical protein